MASLIHVPQFLPTLVPMGRWEKTDYTKLTSDLNICTMALMPTHAHIVHTNDNKYNYLLIDFVGFLVLVFGF